MPPASPLLEAAARGDAAAAAAALAGADVDALDAHGRSALGVAALKGHLACVTLLLERDADVDVEDKDGNTALHLAAQAGHLDCATALLDKSDEDATNEDGNTPAWLALEQGHVEVAKALFDAGADAGVQCEGGRTYLHLAAARNSAAAASHLIERGAKIDALDAERSTPLMVACQSGSWDVGKLLLGAKADAKAAGKDAWTPLHFTAQNKAGVAGALDFAELLVAAGADAKARTRDGMTPSACVALNCGKRSKMVDSEDGDLRCMLQDLEDQ